MVWLRSVGVTLLQQVSMQAALGWVDVYILKELLEATNTGIANKDIESPKCLHRPLDKLSAGFRLGDVAGYDDEPVS